MRLVSFFLDRPLYTFVCRNWYICTQAPPGSILSAHNRLGWCCPKDPRYAWLEEARWWCYGASSSLLPGHRTIQPCLAGHSQAEPGHRTIQPCLAGPSQAKPGHRTMAVPGWSQPSRAGSSYYTAVFGQSQPIRADWTIQSSLTEPKMHLPKMTRMMLQWNVTVRSLSISFIFLFNTSI